MIFYSYSYGINVVKIVYISTYLPTELPNYYHIEGGKKQIDFQNQNKKVLMCTVHFSQISSPPCPFTPPPMKALNYCQNMHTYVI